MTYDEYKRAFGILIQDKLGAWRGSTSDPFARTIQVNGTSLPRVVGLPEERR